MKKRSPAAVFFLSLITFGIYAWVWQVKTKNEMNQLGAQIPTAWLLLVPIINYYWIWKYSEGVEHVTGGRTSAVMSLVLLLLLGIIGMAIIQSEFNKLSAAASPFGPPQPAGMPGQPMPDNSFGGPVVTGGPVAPVAATPAPVNLSQPVQPAVAAPAQPAVSSPAPQTAPAPSPIVAAPAPGQPFPPSDSAAPVPPQPPQNV